MSYFTGATSRFRLLSPSGYNIPKPKMMYFVNFVTNQLNTQTLKHLSFFCKRMDRLQMTYDVTTINQYNKKRLVQGKLEYGPLNFGLHDTVDGTAFKLIEAYNRFYFGDFTNKSESSWSYDVVGSGFEQAQGWGLKGNQTPNSGNFLSRIEVYEIYDQVYSQVDFINPKFTSVDMQPLDIADSAGNEINISSRYEGVVFKAISSPITAELANRFGLPLHNDAFLSLLGGLNIPGFDISSGVGLPGQSVFSSIANILNNTTNGGVVSSGFNNVNSVLNGVIPTALGNSTLFQTINGVLGSTIGASVPALLDIAPVNTLGGLFPEVQERLGLGDPVRDISSAVFDVAGSFFNDFGF